MSRREYTAPGRARCAGRYGEGSEGAVRTSSLEHTEGKCSVR